MATSWMPTERCSPKSTGVKQHDGRIGIWRLKFLTSTAILKATQVCAAAAFVSSAKSACVHPDRKDPYLCPFLSINVMRSEPSDFHTLKVVIALVTRKWRPLSKMRRQELLLDALPISSRQSCRFALLRHLCHLQSRSASIQRGRILIFAGCPSLISKRNSSQLFSTEASGMQFVFVPFFVLARSRRLCREILALTDWRGLPCGLLSRRWLPAERQNPGATRDGAGWRMDGECFQTIQRPDVCLFGMLHIRWIQGLFHMQLKACSWQLLLVCSSDALHVCN